MSRESRRLRKQLDRAHRELRRRRTRELSRRLRDVDERMLERAEEDRLIRPDRRHPMTDPLD